MTPWTIALQWAPVLPIALAAIAVAAFMAAAILVTRYLTNQAWKRDLTKNMPANVREQLALRDRQIEEQAKELLALRDTVQRQDVAIRGIRQISWDVTAHHPPWAQPYVMLTRREGR
jgi:hypothetical protein